MGKSQPKAEQAQPAPGADNNKHLAYLVEAEGQLVAVLTEGGRSLEGEDPFSVAIAQLKEYASLEAKVAELNESLTDASNMLLMGNQGIEARDKRIAELEDAAKAGPNGATEGEIAAIKRAEAAEAALDHANELIAKTATKLVALGVLNDAGAIETILDLTDVDLEFHAVDRDALAATADAPRLSTEDLRFLVDEGQSFQLVFSDGENEIKAIGAIDLPARDLHRHSGRYVVASTITVKGLTAEEAIDGAALFSGDEQVSYCKFDPPIAAKPGEIREFNRTIAFGG